jgi:low molecular weight protein-tyrosine phosphatase
MSRHRSSVLFVCLGNICRSPLAEGVLIHRLAEAGLSEAVRVDSAGTGAWHVGEPVDPRSAEVARKFGIELHGRARRIQAGDLHQFDYVLAMDRSNLRDIKLMNDSENGTARIALFRDFDPEADAARDVPDPYYGGGDGFDRVFEIVDRTCRALVEHLESELQ